MCRTPTREELHEQLDLKLDYEKALKDGNPFKVEYATWDKDEWFPADNPSWSYSLCWRKAKPQKRLYIKLRGGPYAHLCKGKDYWVTTAAYTDHHFIENNISPGIKYYEIVPKAVMDSIWKWIYGDRTEHFETVLNNIKKELEAEWETVDETP